MQRLIWALLGMLAGGALTVALAVLAGYAFDISQAEGAYAMQVAFFWMPVGLVAGLIAGLVLGRGQA
jgi:hypothetical protein